MDFSKVTAICNNKKHVKEVEKAIGRNTNNATANLRKREIKRKDKILSKVVMANLESSSEKSQTSHLGKKEKAWKDFEYSHKKVEESKKGPGRKSNGSP